MQQGGAPAGAPQPSIVQQPPAAGGGGGGTAAAGAGASTTPSRTHEVDFEFLPLIIEILDLLEKGKANKDQVKEKVDYLQGQFSAAKAELEAMDGADLSEAMQAETLDVYKQRLVHVNSLMADYSQLPLFIGEGGKP